MLRRYDADSDGHLDRDEFHGFARTYFSRMEWPFGKLPTALSRGSGSTSHRRCCYNPRSGS